MQQKETNKQINNATDCGDWVSFWGIRQKAIKEKRNKRKQAKKLN